MAPSECFHVRFLQGQLYCCGGHVVFAKGDQWAKSVGRRLQNTVVSAAQCRRQHWKERVAQVGTSLYPQVVTKPYRWNINTCLSWSYTGGYLPGATAHLFYSRSHAVTCRVTPSEFCKWRRHFGLASSYDCMAALSASSLEWVHLLVAAVR